MSLTASLSILGVAMLVGCLQEALQALTSGEDVAWSSASFDLLVDLGGAASVLALAWLWSFHRTGKGVQRKAG